jgi:general secretion pathway protein D
MIHPAYLRVLQLRRSAILCRSLCIAIIAACAASLGASAQSGTIQPATVGSMQQAIAQPVRSRQAQAAEDAYLAGATRLQNNDLTGAEREFAHALALNPANPDYANALTLVREHRVTELVRESTRAKLNGETARSVTLLAEARAIDPNNPIVIEHSDAEPVPTAAERQQHPSELPSGLSDRQRMLFGSANTGIPGVGPVPAFAGAVVLKPDTVAQNFHLRGDSQNLLRSMASSFGLRVTFDSSVEHKDLRFDMDNATYAQAMPTLLNMAHAFAVPIDETSMFIAKDDAPHRDQLARQVEETIYLPGLTTEQINDIANVVRNVFEVKQVVVQTGLESIELRAPADALGPMNRTVADLLDVNSEVELEMKLYTVDATRTRNIGATLPTQAGIYSAEQAATSLVTANQALVNQAIAQGYVSATASNIDIALALIASGLVQSSLLSSTVAFVGNGLTLTGVTANTSTTFNLALNSSDARAVDDVRIRVGDKQTGIFRAGTRYPITTATYSAGLTSATAAAAATAAGAATINGVSVASLLAQYAGGASTTVPQVSFEDLGLTLKTTPQMQKSGRVSLHIELKVEALAGTSNNGIPILTSRQSTSDITVREGESALMISFISRSETGAVSGLPGLSELPGFQVPADKNTEHDTSELVLLITPHVVRRRSNEIAGPRMVVVAHATAN